MPNEKKLIMKRNKLILTFTSICFAIFPLSGYSQNIQVTADQFLLDDRVIEHTTASYITVNLRI